MEELRMGARIARYRKELGLTQEALAHRLGVTNQAVSKWEGDVCCPDIQLLPALADALGLSLDALFGRETPEPPEGRETGGGREGGDRPHRHRGEAALGG